MCLHAPPPRSWMKSHRDASTWRTVSGLHLPLPQSCYKSPGLVAPSCPNSQVPGQAGPAEGLRKETLQRPHPVHCLSSTERENEAQSKEGSGSSHVRRTRCSQTLTWGLLARGSGFGVWDRVQTRDFLLSSPGRGLGIVRQPTWPVEAVFPLASGASLGA